MVTVERIWGMGDQGPEGRGSSEPSPYPGGKRGRSKCLQMLEVAQTGERGRCTDGYLFARKCPTLQLDRDRSTAVQISWSPRSLGALLQGRDGVAGHS